MSRFPIIPPHGAALTCKGWEQEAILRMLMNCLDPQVAEIPEKLVPYMGAKAARSWDDYDKIVEALKNLENDETMVVQSGRPVGVFKSFENAPRVIHANSFLVPEYANHENFHAMLDKGLTMQGGLTAASWAYIGSQGIMGTTYSTLSAVATESLHTETLRGKLVLSAGLGGAGRNQPLAITMQEGVCIIVETDIERIRRSMNPEQRFVDTWTDDLDKAIVMAQEALREDRPLSIALLGNAADIYPAFAKKDVVPDVLTDMTPAHDELSYIPSGLTAEQAARLRKDDPREYSRRSYACMVRQCQAMIEMKNKGTVVFEFGNWIRAQATKGGMKDAYQFPGFVDRYTRALFCKGIGGFRYIALSGNPEDIYKIDEAVKKRFPRVANWIDMCQKYIPFQGLPARICWLGHGERAEATLMINDMVARGELEAPVSFSKCLIDVGSMASPDTQTGNMKDGSDIIGDWPILKGMLHAATGAVSVTMISEPEHYATGVITVADGSSKAAQKLLRAQNADTGLGIINLADAGYEEAIRVCKDSKIHTLSLA